MVDGISFIDRGLPLFNFEKLDAWQLAIQYASHVYKATVKFPPDERFGLTSQLRRAAVSVSTNLAEGSGRGTPKEFTRFIEIAFGSLMETVAHIAIARQENELEPDIHEEPYSQAERLGKVLSGLRRSLET